MSYLGVPPFGQTVRTVTTETANGTANTFYPTGGYIVGYLDVFYNGVRVVDTVDYTAGDGTSVSFTLPPTSNSTIEMVSYGPISFVDSISRSGDTMGGTLNVRDLIPVSNNTYNLGNTTNRFSNVYLSGNTIILGNTIISSNGSSVSFTDANNTLISISANLSASLPATGVTANTYGNTTAIPVITVDSTGRITNATTSSVSGVTGVSYTAANSTLTVSTSTTNYNATLNSANSTVAGLVAVLDSVSNTSTSIAASANSVKAAYDAAGNAYSNVFTGGTFTGAVILQANLTSNNVSVTGNIQVDGNLTVSGNTVSINTTNLSVEDNMIYLNANNTVSNPDLGFAGNYNDGTYRHAGLFRDATDGVWKFFHQYQPEPDASAYIDTANNTFALANVQANTFIGAVSATTITITSTLTANGSTGTAGHVLHSNGTTGSPYWAADDQGVTSVASGDGLSGGTITSTGTLSVSAQSGLLANSTGLYVNATSIALGTVPTARLGTGTANSTTFLAGDQTYKTISAGGSSASDDTTTNGTRYVLFANQTSGSITTAYVSSTKLTYNPSTGTLTSTLVTASSDEKLKTNIKTIDDPIDVINSLRGVSFDRIDTDQSDFGVIAQEVEKVIPDVVHQDSDGYKSVSYNSIIGFLIEGMKQQQKRIDILEYEVNNLKK